MIRKVIVLVLAVAILASFGAFYRYDVETTGNSVSSSGFFASESVVSYRMNCSVVETESEEMQIGIAVQTYEMDFGVLPVGTGATKYINLTNNEPMPVKISLSVDGSIEPFVEINENNYILFTRQ